MSSEDLDTESPAPEPRDSKPRTASVDDIMRAAKEKIARLKKQTEVHVGEIRANAGSRLNEVQKAEDNKIANVSAQTETDIAAVKANSDDRTRELRLQTEALISHVNKDAEEEVEAAERIENSQIVDIKKEVAKEIAAALLAKMDVEEPEAADIQPLPAPASDEASKELEELEKEDEPDDFEDDEEEDDNEIAADLDDDTSLPKPNNDAAPEDAVEALPEPAIESSSPADVSGPKTRALPIIALVLSFIAPLVGLVLGIVVLIQTKKQPGIGGKNIALASIIIGGVLTLITLLMLFII